MQEFISLAETLGIVGVLSGNVYFLSRTLNNERAYYRQLSSALLIGLIIAIAPAEKASAIVEALTTVEWDKGTE